MLPFDLHVLGLPPAFTLSQDQTLHLKLQNVRPKAWFNFLSAVVYPGPNKLDYLQLLAFLIHLDSVSNVC